MNFAGWWKFAAKHQTGQDPVGSHKDHTWQNHNLIFTFKNTEQLHEWNKWGCRSEPPWGHLFVHYFPREIGNWNVDFCEGKKTKKSERNTWRKGRTSPKCLTLMWSQVRESNLGTVLRGERSLHCIIPDPLQAPLSALRRPRNKRDRKQTNADQDYIFK